MNNMTEADFMAYAEGFLAESLGVMIQANQEYASPEGKFDNFIGIAQFMRTFNPRLKDITPQDVAWIYRMKHFISIMKGISIREDMSGREADDINYGLMISGMNEADRKASSVS